MDISKSIGPVLTLVVAGCAAIWSYITYQDKARLDFQQPFVDRTIGLCFEVTQLVGELVSEPTESEWNKRRDRFWTLCVGPMILVAQEDLAKAIDDFGKVLVLASASNRTGLNPGAVNVSQACRKQLNEMRKNDWKISTDLIPSPEAITIPIKGQLN
jgi:hypothetical protein